MANLVCLLKKPARQVFIKCYCMASMPALLPYTLAELPNTKRVSGKPLDLSASTHPPCTAFILPPSSPMPPPPHILAAAAWFYLFVMLPLARYGHSKPRLAAQQQRIDHVLASERRCLQITRFTHAELMELCELLGIRTDEQAHGNWRFSELHRLVIALYCLSAQQCLRHAKQQWGWAMNSISNNIELMCELIISRLDAPDSGSTCCTAHHGGQRLFASLLTMLCVCCAADAISGWTMAEQDAWIAAPAAPAEFHDCIGIVDATYIKVQHGHSAMLWNEGSIRHTRSLTACSSWRSWTGEVSCSTAERVQHRQTALAHHVAWLCLVVGQAASATSMLETAHAEALSLLLSSSRAMSSCSPGCSSWAMWHTRLMIASRQAGAVLTSILLAWGLQLQRSVAATTSASPPCAFALSMPSLASNIHGNCCRPHGRCLSTASLPLCAHALFSQTTLLVLETCTCKKKYACMLSRLNRLRDEQARWQSYTDSAAESLSHALIWILLSPAAVRSSFSMEASMSVLVD